MILSWLCVLFLRVDVPIRGISEIKTRFRHGESHAAFSKVILREQIGGKCALYQRDRRLWVSGHRALMISWKPRAKSVEDYSDVLGLIKISGSHLKFGTKIPQSQRVQNPPALRSVSSEETCFHRWCGTTSLRVLRVQCGLEHFSLGG